MHSPLFLCMFFPFYPHWHSRSGYTWRIVQVTKLFIMLFSPVTCHFDPRWSKYFQHPVLKPLTVAERSKTWTTFAQTDTGVVGSNPIRGVDAYVHSLFVALFVGSYLATSWSPVQGILSTVCIGLGN
jgi:hypothetical protein